MNPVTMELISVIGMIVTAVVIFRITERKRRDK